MKKSIIFLIFFISVSSIFSKYQNFNDRQLKEILPSTTRLAYSLSGTWDFTSNDMRQTRVELPSVSRQTGKLIFQRQFTIEKSMLDKFDWSLYFLGIGYEAEIYINEQFIGKFVSNLMPFSVDIPKKVLANSKNSLKIIVNNNKDNFENTRINDIFAPANALGIPRDLFLIGKPQLQVSNIFYTSTIDRKMTSAVIKVKAEIKSKDLENLSRISTVDSLGNKVITSKSYFVQFLIKDKSTGALLTSSEMYPFNIESQRTITKEYRFNVTGFKAWSKETPDLYEIVCKIFAGSSLVDEDMKDFAFRLFETYDKSDYKSFLMNGNPFQFKGVEYVENLMNYNSAVSPTNFEEEFRQMQILGANAIIFKYNFPNPYLIKLCDKYGILAFIELPLYNTPNKVLTSENVLSDITNQAKNIISQYSGFPSVVAFGLGQGLEDNTSGYEKYLNSITKILKGGTDRLLYKTVYSQNKLTYNDNLDFLIFKSFVSRKSFEDINLEYSDLRNKVKPLPVIMSYGTPIQNKNHNGYSDPLSVDFQSYYAQNLYKISLANNGYGSIYSNFADYYSQYPILATGFIDDKFVSKGLIDLNHKNKTTFEVLKALFNEENEPLVDIGNFSSTVYTFIILSLLLIIGFFMLFSRFRRFQEYFIRAILRPYNFYSDIRDQRILSPMYTYILGIMIALSFGIFSETLLYFFKSTETLQYLLMLFFPNEIVLSILFKIIWIPFIGVFVFALLYLIFIYLTALIIRLFAYFRHLNVHNFDVMNITIWGSLPLIFLLPFDIILYKLFQINSGLIMITMIASVLIILFSIFRILKATAVLFDANFTKVYLIGVGVFVLIFLGFYLFYQSQTNFLSSLSYYFSVLM